MIPRTFTRRKVEIINILHSHQKVEIKEGNDKRRKETDESHRGMITSVSFVLQGFQFLGNGAIKPSRATQKRS